METKTSQCAGSDREQHANHVGLEHVADLLRVLSCADRQRFRDRFMTGRIFSIDELTSLVGAPTFLRIGPALSPEFTEPCLRVFKYLVISAIVRIGNFGQLEDLVYNISEAISKNKDLTPFWEFNTTERHLWVKYTHPVPVVVSAALWACNPEIEGKDMALHAENMASAMAEHYASYWPWPLRPVVYRMKLAAEMRMMASALRKLISAGHDAATTCD